MMKVTQQHVQGLVFLTILLSGLIPTSAADFNTFQIGDKYCGYVVKDSNNGGTVHGLPGIQFVDVTDAEIGIGVSVKLIGVPTATSSQYAFKLAALKQCFGDDFANQHIGAFGMTAPIAKNLILRLRVGDQIVGEETINPGLTMPINDYTVWYKGKDSIISRALRSANARIEAVYLFPYQQFSELKVDVDESGLSNAKVEAFQEMVQESADTQGGFFVR
jgi:hypothetical protein